MIIFKKKSPTVTPPVPSAPKPAMVVKASTKPLPIPVAATPAVLPPPKVVLKFGAPKPVSGGVVIKSADPVMTQRQQKALVDSGLMDSSQQTYERLQVGDPVVITNTMFPQYKHWKPGDRGVIKFIMNNTDPLGEDDVKYRYHVILLTEPLEASRKGQTTAMFRWEFERSNKTNAPMGVTKHSI